MLSPVRGTKKPKRARRAVVHVPPNPGGFVDVVTEKAAQRFRGHAAFLQWLTDPTQSRGASQIWLTPGSVGWDVFVPPLLRAGYKLAPSKRRGEYTGLRVTAVGRPIGAEQTDLDGLGWQGRSASGLIAIPSGLSGEEQATEAWRQIDTIAKAVESHWSGITLGPSIASTGIDALRTHLTAPLGCAAHVALELRQRDAYGGGRIECYCKKGSTFDAADTLDGIADVDMNRAYPSAMKRTPIPGEFADFGPESAVFDDCTISTVIVEVPESLYPPLRYRIGEDVYYPYGMLLGTWTSHELRAAVRLGCKIHRVHSVMRFVAREEFAAFAESVIAFRDYATDPALELFAKGVAVQTVGALASKPSTRRILCAGEESTIGLRLDRPGVYEEECFRPSGREILSSAIGITGPVRAWMALLLGELERRAMRVIYVHTDGCAMLGDPTEALRAVGLEDGAWKRTSPSKIQIWSAGQRITTIDGIEHVAAGGLSRRLTKEELCNRLRAADEQIRATAWMESRREPDGEWTKPQATDTLDAARSNRIRRIIECPA